MDKQVIVIWTLDNEKKIEITNCHNEDILRARLKQEGIEIIKEERLDQYGHS